MQKLKAVNEKVGIWGYGKREKHLNSSTPKLINGFTLIEVLIALTILTLIITSSLVTLSNNLKTARILKEQLIAVNLAQEGLEIVRNIRDRDWFLSNSFGDSLPEGGPYIIEWNSDSLTLSATPPRIKKDVNGLYSYATGNVTEFTRTITITDIIEGSVIHKQVIADVSWLAGTKTVNAELHLYDWR